MEAPVREYIDDGVFVWEYPLGARLTLPSSFAIGLTCTVQVIVTVGSKRDSVVVSLENKSCSSAHFFPQYERIKAPFKAREAEYLSYAYRRYGLTYEGV